MVYRAFLPLLLVASAAHADGCPTVPDHEAALDGLYAQVQRAPSQRAAQVIGSRMWELWLDAPDEPSQHMLDEAIRAMRIGDYVRAQDRLTALVSYCPFYAEGYNQRAFLSFLREDYKAVLPDIDEAIRLNPRHTGALTGKARTLIALGRDAEAQIMLKDAVALNPWLGERALITEPQGEEL